MSLSSAICFQAQLQNGLLLRKVPLSLCFLIVSTKCKRNEPCIVCFQTLECLDGLVVRRRSNEFHPYSCRLFCGITAGETDLSLRSGWNVTRVHGYHACLLCQFSSAIHSKCLWTCLGSSSSVFCEAFAKYNVRERVALNLPACSLLTALNCAGDEHSICMQKENGKDALTVIYESSDSIVQLGCLFHSNNVSFVVSGVYQYCFFCFWFLFSLLWQQTEISQGSVPFALDGRRGGAFYYSRGKVHCDHQYEFETLQSNSVWSWITSNTNVLPWTCIGLIGRISFEKRKQPRQIPSRSTSRKIVSSLNLWVVPAKARFCVNKKKRVERRKKLMKWKMYREIRW